MPNFHCGRAGVCLVALCVGGCAARVRPAMTAVRGPSPERRVIEQALDLVADPAAYPVVVIDPETVPDSAAVRRLDAFIVRDADGSLRHNIYINRESNVLQEAVKGSALYGPVLAAIIVHEQVHLAGGSEDEARRAESAFFGRLVANGLVRWEDGVRYRELLRQRDAHGEMTR